MYTGSFEDYDNIAEYINKELELGRTQGDIEVNDFNVKEKVIAKRLSRRGYKKIGGKWIKVDGSDSANNKVISNNSSKVITNNTNNSSSKSLGVSLTKDQSNNLLSLANKYSDLDYLISNIDNIKLMLDAFNKQYDKMYDTTDDKKPWGITIELPIEGDKNFRTTIRVNDVVWKQFDEFCNKHSEFTKRDLISMAFREYISNHSSDDDH